MFSGKTTYLHNTFLARKLVYPVLDVNVRRFAVFLVNVYFVIDWLKASRAEKPSSIMSCSVDEDGDALGFNVDVGDVSSVYYTV